jgi:prohibitin 2
MHYFIVLAVIAVITTAAFFALRLTNPTLQRYVLGAGGAAVVVWTLLCSFHQIPAGHVGLQYSFGAIAGKTADGLQTILPWRTLRPASIRVQSMRFSKLESFSRESQDVYLRAVVNFHVAGEGIVPLYTNVGPSYFAILIEPRVNQYLKDETVKLSSVDVAPNRETIRKAVRDRLTAELRSHSIVVDDFVIENITFSKEFQAAIESKQAQTQLALAEQEKVAAERARAQQAIERAKGEGESVLQRALKEAEANRAVAASITPELVHYNTVQRLAPNVSVMLLPAGQQFVLGSDVLKSAQRTPAATPPRQ